MILEFFTTLSNMLNSSPGIAIAGSFLWGIAGIILSPCHLASIPLVVGFIDKQGKISTGRAAVISTFFSSGILATIGLVGLITGLLGRMMGDVGQAGNIIVAVILVIIGLYLMGIIRLPFLESGVNQPGMKRKGPIAAFLLGLIFGLALGPCTFAYMAPMLGVAFAVASSSLAYAAALVLAYTIGHCSVIIIAGTFTETVNHLLRWNDESKGAAVVKKACGALVSTAGVYMLISALRVYGG
ncbi:MAG: cytochrome C biogenesis protein [Spirochaetes bacterium]|nr:cytochrome C biogenesis protein [Spirochaetota bacterium]